VGYDEAVARWVGEQVRIADFGPYTAIGFINAAEELLGGVVYSNYRHPNIEATIATVSPKWCSRRVLSAIFSYPFFQLRCTRLTAVTEIMNQPARAFLCRLGFQEEGVLRKAFPGGIDAVVYGLLAEECRWLTVEEPMRSVAA
jgi:RimJ/RimL family protein N-acetyltransferase